MAQGQVPTKGPVARKVSVRGLSIALSGREKPYDVYRFSGRPFFERANHNPFKGIAPDP